MLRNGKLNLLLKNSINLVFSSLEIQRRLIQIKSYYTFFYSVWKETSNKFSKVAAAKKADDHFAIKSKIYRFLLYFICLPEY